MLANFFPIHIVDLYFIFSEKFLRMTVFLSQQYVVLPSTVLLMIVAEEILTGWILFSFFLSKDASQTKCKIHIYIICFLMYRVVNPIQLVGSCTDSDWTSWGAMTKFGTKNLSYVKVVWGSKAIICQKAYPLKYNFSKSGLKWPAPMTISNVLFQAVWLHSNLKNNLGHISNTSIYISII